MRFQRRVLSSVVIGVALASVAVASSTARIGARRQRAAPYAQRQATDRLLSAGLHAAAQLAGSFSENDYYPPTRLADLGELCDLADLIVVGTPDSNSSRPTTDGLSIVTVYNVSVESVLKGKVPAPSKKGPAILSIAVLGGRVDYPDGTSATVTVPYLHMPLNGQRSMWFIRQAPMGYVSEMTDLVSPLFVLAGGPLGLYDLAPDRAPFVMPAANFSSPIAEHLHSEKINGDAFVAEVTESLRNR